MNSLQETQPTSENSTTHKITLSNAGKLWSIFLGTLIVLGGHYLRSYLSSMNVPFPMELNVLATSLLLMGIASVLLVLSLIFLLLFTFIIRMLPVGWDYNELVIPDFSKSQEPNNQTKSKKNDDAAKNIKTGLTLFYLGFTPIALVFGIIYAQSAGWFDLEEIGSLSALVAALLVTSLFFAVWKFSTWRKFFVRLGFCFIVQICVAVIWTFPTTLFMGIGLVSTDFELIVLISSLIALYIVGLWPSDESHESESSSVGAVIRSSIVRNPAAFFAFFFIAILTILPPVSAQIGKGALRFFDVGGGIPHEISLNETLKAGLSGLDLDVDKDAKSVMGSLIFRVNETSYYEINKKIIPINTKNLTVNLAPQRTKDSSEGPRKGGSERDEHTSS